MGDRENWDHLLQFVESHDLAEPANYAYVQSQVDMANFIDYTHPPNLLQPTWTGRTTTCTNFAPVWQGAAGSGCSGTPITALG